MRLTNAFRDVEREVHINGSPRKENDVEHSFQLAVVAWYILDRCSLPLSRETVLMYALVHDLVEVYAGDVMFYDTDSTARREKHQRERAAAQRLQREFPEWEALHACIEAYETREEPEARFVYALDKLLPICNIYLDGGRTWREHGISLSELETLKREKITESAAVEDIFDELIARLREEEPDLFPAVKEKNNS